MSPLLCSLLKNAEVADFISPLIADVETADPHAAEDQGLTTMQPSWVGAILPLQHRQEHSYYETLSSWTRKSPTLKWNIIKACLFWKTQFHAGPLCPQLIKAASLQPVQRAFLASVLPASCSSISLESFLGFPLYFYLGEPKNLNTSNSCLHLLVKWLQRSELWTPSGELHSEKFSKETKLFNTLTGD